MIWKGVYGRMRVKPEEGLDVIATGKLTTYPGSSKYQIVIDTLEPAGIGALMALLEERKKKLAAEGLFDEARKQLLPFLPEVIGVVTSPTGAVIRDILHRLADRFPRRVLVWPVRVQGETVGGRSRRRHRRLQCAAGDGPLPRPDLIIVARGGGSLEDLWSFNEEIVVRAAAASMIPLISAVGHETDMTLIDFASDRRAPTPTAAAEMAVPVRAELHGRDRQRLAAAQACLLAARHGRAPHANCARLRARCRGTSLAGPRQRLDALRRPAAARAPRQCATAPDAIDPCRRPPVAAAAAKGQRLRERYDGKREIVVALDQRRDRRALRVALDRRSQRLRIRAGQLLAAFSYRGVLGRGFALVRDGEGRTLRAAAAVAAGMRLDIEFADGRVGAVADGEGQEKSKPQPAPARAKPRSRGGGSRAGRAACLAPRFWATSRAMGFRAQP